MQSPLPEPPARQATWWVLLPALITCALLPLVAGHASARIEPSASSAQQEWPRELDGQLLRPLALGDVERRFAARFPGQIGRFSTGQAVVTLRATTRPTRMLHPAADCYQGLGYRIRDTRLEQDDQARTWRCFIAWRDGRALRVCERIAAADGTAFTDTSAWYWHAIAGKTRGPWLAVTRAQVLHP